MVAGARRHRPDDPAEVVTAVVKTGIGLLAGWLLAAMLLLAHDGRLGQYLAGAASGSVLALGIVALVRWHRRPSLYCKPSTPPQPACYRVANDLDRPLAEVVAVAEQDAAAVHREP
jgi:hypothetical protein